MNFSDIFFELKSIMLPFAEKLDIITNESDKFSLNTRHTMENGKPLWFGGVEIKKNYVSYHLMPVYLNPDLLKNAPAILKKRMQGKSCFNFKNIDQNLFNELRTLTEACYHDYKNKGYIE